VRKLFKNGRYANVTATIALFVALGGSSYAAIKLPANSVSTKQIKKGAVTLNRISSGARAALKGQKGERGPQGPQGPAGAAGVSSGTPVLWATVNNGNTVADRSSHAVGATPFGTGEYNVTFDRDVTKCAFSATLGGQPGVNPAGEIQARSRDDLHPTEVTVDTFNSVGAHADAPFMLIAIC